MGIFFYKTASTINDKAAYEKYARSCHTSACANRKSPAHNRRGFHQCYKLDTDLIYWSGRRTAHINNNDQAAKPSIRDDQVPNIFVVLPVPRTAFILQS